MRSAGDLSSAQANLAIEVVDHPGARARVFRQHEYINTVHKLLADVEVPEAVALTTLAAVTLTQ
jgi:hypothetical protein